MHIFPLIDTCRTSHSGPQGSPRSSSPPDLGSDLPRAALLQLGSWTSVLFPQSSSPVPGVGSHQPRSGAGPGLTRGQCSAWSEVKYPVTGKPRRGSPFPQSQPGVLGTGQLIGDKVHFLCTLVKPAPFLVHKLKSGILDPTTSNRCSGAFQGAKVLRVCWVSQSSL